MSDERPKLKPAPYRPTFEDNKFRSITGAYVTRALFYEQCINYPGQIDLSKAIYTLKRDDYTRDGVTYIALYRKYIEVGDPTEYEFANEYFDGWEHWKKVCSCNWFKPFIQQWREELEIKFKSDALREIANKAREGGKDSYQANKFLVESGWIEKYKIGPVGRPKKEKIIQETFTSDEELKQLEELKDLVNNSGTVN